MDFDDGKQQMVCCLRQSVEDLTSPEIVNLLTVEAAKDNLEPFDLNWDGKPNIYLRGKYKREEDGSFTHLADWFVMFVR